MTSPRLIVSACLMAGALSSVMACASGKDTAPASGGKTAPTAAATAPINAECPMSGEAVDVESGGSTVFKGKTVGFCCAKCAQGFAALDDAGKTAALAEHGTTLPK